MGSYGFIGLGSQGAPMARRMIEAGLPVVLWARREETLEPFSDTDAGFAASIRELGEQVDYCAICVVDDAGTRQVCSELLPAMQPGGVVVIHSTVNPALCRELAEQASERGIALVDAPVSGGGQAAADGTLAVMLGGETDTIERVKSVLGTFAGTIVHLGGHGAGQTAKLINNTLMAANLANAWHALEAAGALGIDRSALADLVKVSSGRSFAFEVGVRMTEPRAFEHGAKLLAKDVRLLGETLGEQENFTVLRTTANTFLDRALSD